MPSRTVLIQILALLVLLAADLRWARPWYDWDLLAYTAVALRFGGASSQEAWEGAYRSVREAVPPPDWALLTNANGYRRITAADPEAFGQQLPFYTVKPAYPALVLALERVGMDPVGAAYVIARAAWVGTGIVLLLWASALLPPVVAVLTTWAAMSMPFALDLARIPTPDALSALVILTALWQVFQRDRFLAGGLLLVASVAVRPDNLLWVLPVAAWGALRPERRMGAAGMVLGGMLLYGVLNVASGHPGWAVLFHHSFVERLPYPGDFVPSLSPSTWARVVLRETHPVNQPPFLLLFGLLGVALLARRVASHGAGDRYAALLGVSALFAAGHWPIFPESDRFFAVPYLVVVLMLVWTLVGERPPPAEALSRRPTTPERGDPAPPRDPGDGRGVGPLPAE